MVPLNPEDLCYLMALICPLFLFGQYFPVGQEGLVVQLDPVVLVLLLHHHQLLYHHRMSHSPLGGQVTLVLQADRDLPADLVLIL